MPDDPLRVVELAERSDTGRVRDHNEDNYLVDKKLSLSVVADGMGGHAAGEVASAGNNRPTHRKNFWTVAARGLIGRESTAQRSQPKETSQP